MAGDFVPGISPLMAVMQSAALMEEAGEVAGTDKTHRFIVDPLDGTTNINDEMFFAEKDKGAFLNDGRLGGADRRLRPTKRDIFTDCLFSTGIPFMGKPGHAKFLKELHQVMGASAGVRRLGSAALDLAWVAAGRYDGFWERDLQIWDIAAGVFICQQAGLEVESLTGGNVLETCDPIVTNEALMPYLRKRVE